MSVKLDRKRERIMDRISRKSSKGKQEKDSYHIIHKVPHGDGPYVKAKHAQVCSICVYVLFIFLILNLRSLV